MKKTAQTVKRDAYQEITDRIVEALEKGVTPWVKPWSSYSGNAYPSNAITGRHYNGINFILLAMSPYASNKWLTYKQAQDVGAQVRKGEHGTQVVLFKPIKVEDKEVEGRDKTIPLLRTFTVFNIEQVDGLPEKYKDKITTSKPKTIKTNKAAEELMSAAIVKHGGDRAFYVPSRDFIQLPEKSAFKTSGDYYGTALHELTHWTGHKSRLARDFSGRFGDAAYAFEELVAELGAAFTCAHCEVDGSLQHENYIASWIKVLKGDKKAIFTASSSARKAAELLTGSQQEAEEKEAA